MNRDSTFAQNQWRWRERCTCAPSKYWWVHFKSNASLSLHTLVQSLCLPFRCGFRFQVPHFRSVHLISESSRLPYAGSRPFPWPAAHFPARSVCVFPWHLLIATCKKIDTLKLETFEVQTIDTMNSQLAYAHIIHLLRTSFPIRRARMWLLQTCVCVCLMSVHLDAILNPLTKIHIYNSWLECIVHSMVFRSRLNVSIIVDAHR